MNQSVKTFDGHDHQFTPEEHLQQISAHIIFTEVEQPANLVDSNQWHQRKMACLQFSLTGIAFIWVLQIREILKKVWFAFIPAFEKQVSTQKTAYYAQVNRRKRLKT